MALGPLRSHPPRLADHSIQRRRDNEVDTSKPKTVREWEQQLDEELQGSLTYQVVKRVLLNESISVQQSEINTVASDDSATPSPQQVELEIELHVELQVHVELKVALAQSQSATQKSDPLILDINNNGIHFDATKRITFDLNGDGQTERLSQLSSGDYFLAFDKNANGVIDNGIELFGDQLGDNNGFTALARYDDNRDNIIDASDRIFSALRLLQIDGDGRQTQTTLQNAGIKALDLRYQQAQQIFSGGDEIAQLGSFYRTDNSRGQMADVLFQFQV